MSDFKFPIGANVVIECGGRVIEQRRNSRGMIYVIQPNDRNLPRIHAPVETVFPLDDDSEPVTAEVEAA